MLVAILGVMKAGAGYLPIEPDAPADRVALHHRPTAARSCSSADGSDFGLPDVLRVASARLDARAACDPGSRARPSTSRT